MFGVVNDGSASYEALFHLSAFQMRDVAVSLRSGVQSTTNINSVC